MTRELVCGAHLAREKTSAFSHIAKRSGGPQALRWDQKHSEVVVGPEILCWSNPKTRKLLQHSPPHWVVFPLFEANRPVFRMGRVGAIEGSLVV